MKIALLGYGRMGKAIEKIALERGHSIVAKVDKEDTSGELNTADVAINFSIPDAAVNNIKSALKEQIPVVCGTTGWLNQQKEVEDYCLQNDTAFLYASNFSVGVNLFFKLNTLLAKLMQPHKEHFSTRLEETHHVHKLDAPSGTAITLAEGVMTENSELKNWVLDKKEYGKLSIYSHREGEIPGTHSIHYTSSVDEISITHEAKSRQGFALGAVIAAEWIQNKKGIFSMDDVLKL